MINKTGRYSIILTLIVLFGLILSGCRQVEPEIDVEAQRTGFAQTANAQGTQTAVTQPTATETVVPTPTLTHTPAPSNTPQLTPTDSEQVAPPPTGGSDVAQWLANDPPDNTPFGPGEAFTVTWTIENVGTSTWTANYYIEFASGDQMEAPEKVFLPYPVRPNTNVQISVDFIAPTATGTKQSNWKLVNANDNAFYDFYVIVDIVEGGGSPTTTEEP